MATIKWQLATENYVFTEYDGEIIFTSKEFADHLPTDAWPVIDQFIPGNPLLVRIILELIDVVKCVQDDFKVLEETHLALQEIHGKKSFKDAGSGPNG